MRGLQCLLTDGKFLDQTDSNVVLNYSRPLARTSVVTQETEAFMGEDDIESQAKGTPTGQRGNQAFPLHREALLSAKLLPGVVPESQMDEYSTSLLPNPSDGNQRTRVSIFLSHAQSNLAS